MATAPMPGSTPPPKGGIVRGNKAGYTLTRKLIQARTHEFTLNSTFSKHGYRNREDLTNLPPGILVSPSQNVLTNVDGTVSNRKGYILDGASNSTLAGILSSFDYHTSKGYERNLRAGFLTSAGNDGKLQYRYVDSSGNVTWTNLMTGLTSVSFNFVPLYDTTESEDLLLFVNGTSNIYEWSGANTTFASATVNTVTKQGTTSWAQEGFYLNGTRTITINGVDATYSGGETTTTLTGVSVDFSATAVGAEIHQTPRTTANAAISGIPSTFANALISNLRGYIFLGSLTDNQIYISKVGNYKDFTFTAPTRVVGEGYKYPLNGTPTAFQVQEDTMYLSAGKDLWYEVTATLSSDLTKETIEFTPLKTTALQGATSQGLVCKIKNDIGFISNETIFNTIGRVSNNLATPQVTDISYPIVNDMNALDFTNGQVLYHRKFVYITAPNSGKMIVYNMTDDKNHYWEAPQIFPFARLSIIGGNLYGHNYGVPETYQMFVGFNDNANPASCVAAFSYENSGSRAIKKNQNKYYTEGYISSNTILTETRKYDFGGFTSILSNNINGADNSIIFQTSADGSLGKNPLGEEPLGSITDSLSNLPKFRVINTFPRLNYYEYQVQYSTNDVDAQWKLLAFGSNGGIATDLQSEISQ